MLDQVKQFQTQTGIWQTQQDIAESNIKQSQLWENPTVSVQQTGFKSGKDQELELGISQKLDILVYVPQQKTSKCSAKSS